jgi:hypothetical protein
VEDQQQAVSETNPATTEYIAPDKEADYINSNIEDYGDTAQTDEPRQEEPIPQLTPEAVQSQSMIDESEEPKGWFSGIGGAVLCVLLLGLVLGLLIWWVWGKSPLVTWVKIGISILPVIILFIII